LIRRTRCIAISVVGGNALQFWRAFEGARPKASKDLEGFTEWAAQRLNLKAQLPWTQTNYLFSTNGYYDQMFLPLESCTTDSSRHFLLNWGIDFAQNLSETKLGNRHKMTAIDYTTRCNMAEIITHRGSSLNAEATRAYEQIRQYNL
ncbi:hypothetical protein HDU92_008684, partial [Lobulomyces angularis]